MDISGNKNDDKGVPVTLMMYAGKERKMAIWVKSFLFVDMMLNDSLYVKQKPRDFMSLGG